MTLSERLAEYVRACFTGLWIQSYEHDDALAELAALCHRERWRMATWDIEQGLCVVGADQQAVSASDPLAAIRAVNALGTGEGSALLVLANFHRFLNSTEIVQAVARQVTAGKQNRTFLVVLSPVVQIPTELEKLFVVLEHQLPERQQLEEIARGIATRKGELPGGEELARVLDAAAGLTRYEAEGAFSLSLVRHARIEPASIWELKAQMLKKSGLLSLYHGHETFSGLGGLQALKTFCLRAMRHRVVEEAHKRPRGVLLLGVPGSGKSAFCRALGAETGRPTLTLDVGALMGSLVGQTESQTRQALRMADAMAPCILMIDEVEKALAGATGGASGDSGVSARMFGSLLTWLNDHETDVFVVCTANDVSKLPPEFSRAERFDAVFFLDLPGVQERRAIWNLYVEQFGLDTKQPKPVDADWTGAEIKACCRLAALLDVSLVEAAQNVVPVARTAAESVERLRTWASGRCLERGHAGHLPAQRRTGREAQPEGESRSVEQLIRAERAGAYASRKPDDRRCPSKAHLAYSARQKHRPRNLSRDSVHPKENAVTNPANRVQARDEAAEDAFARYDFGLHRQGLRRLAVLAQHRQERVVYLELGEDGPSLKAILVIEFHPHSATIKSCAATLNGERIGSLPSALPPPECWFCWKEYDAVSTIEELPADVFPRLLTPWSDPYQHEFPMDGLFKTPEEARASKRELAPYENWVLCKLILEPVELGPAEPEGSDDEALSVDDDVQPRC